MRWWRGLSLRGRFVVVGVAVLVLVLLRMLSVMAFEARLEDAEASVQREGQVQLYDQSLLTAMLNQESGIRAFAATGQAQFLSPYTDGRTATSDLLDQLSDSEAGTDSGALLGPVRQTAESWELWAERTRLEAVKGGPAAVTDNDQAEGKRLFDAFRAALSRLSSDSRAEVSAAQQVLATDRAHLTIGELLGTALLVLALLGLSAIFFGSTLRPLASLAVIARGLRDGAEVQIPPAERADEVGELAAALGDWQRVAAEKLRLAEDLARERHTWEQMFMVSRDLHCLLGLDGYLQQVNPAWSGAVGYTENELRSQPFVDFIHPADRERTLQEARSQFEGGAVRLEMRFRHKDGGYRWLEWTATPAPTEGRVYAIARDITDRKLQERALTDLNRAAVSMSGVADPSVLGKIVVTGAMELLAVDTSTLCWFDLERQELITLADSEDAIGLPANRRLGEGALGIAARDAKAVAVDDYRSWPGAIKVESSRMPASVLAVPLMSGRNVAGALAVASQSPRHFEEHEIQLLSLLAAQAAPALEQAALFEQLQNANIELRHASEVKTSFLASMSHELRTPLNAILGFSELLIDNPDEAPATRQGYLETIHGSGQHLLSLINDLLDVAKIEAGRMELEPESLRLYPVVSEVVSSLGSLAAAKGMPVQVDVRPSLTVTADARHLRQILINLLSNAFKFTPVGGAIKVVAKQRGGEVAVAVIDTGVGIAPEHQAGIFDQFTQVRSASQQAQQGTGLGLALTKRLVELNGGQVSVSSQVGHGSTFTVHLPTSRKSGAKPTVVPPASGRPLILIVEDDPAAAELLQRHLRAGGYETAIAPRGADALDLAQDLRPMAITLDLLLPDLDGWEVLRSLKSSPTTRDIPVVIVSVLDDHRRAEALGAVDFLVKPIEPAALLARLNALVPPRIGTQPMRVLAIDDDSATLAQVERALSADGIEVITASGGAEGVAQARKCSPDALVVDLLMPEVDGFEVIATLRSEAKTRQTPILVLTAKDLTAEDKHRLNGQVTAILRKSQPAALDLLSWVRAIDTSRTSSPR